MIADKVLGCNTILKFAFGMCLGISSVGVFIMGSSLNAKAGAGNAPVNVPGRYVSSDGSNGVPKTATSPSAAPATTANLGRYVSEGQSGDANLNGSTGRGSSTAASSYGSGPIQRALSEVRSIYGKRFNDSDLKAMESFYQNRADEMLWVGSNGLTDKGAAVRAEILKADEWGLSRADFDIPDTTAPTATETDRAHSEIRMSLSVLKYVRFARGGRVDPGKISRFLDEDPELMDPNEVLPKITAANEPDAFLRAQHPTHPQFAKLKKALAALRDKKKTKPVPPPEDALSRAKKVRIPDGPTLREGMTHANVKPLRERLQVVAQADNELKFDEPLRAALEKFQGENNLSADGVLGGRTRRALNGEGKARKRKPASKEARIQKIVINMERWRWMPREPGSFYIWNNIPEFRTRIYKDDTPIYSEIIIVGKNKNPTPTFSADMKLVVFHPSWGVPNGIKKTEILPYLKKPSGFFGWGGADTRILKRHNLTVSRNGRPVDASKVNWSKVDIRQYTFIQPPSSTNVLGKVKFRFPNKHDVYMHDTPERHLFKNARRTFSHGCMRVKKPRLLAEAILKHDKGWDSEKVGGYWRRGGTVKLDTPFAVHTGYLTAIVDDAGKVKTISDVYGYDGRLARALGRKPLRLAADNVRSSSGGSAGYASQPRKKKKKKKAAKGPETVADIISNVFSP